MYWVWTAHVGAQTDKGYIMISMNQKRFAGLAGVMGIGLLLAGCLDGNGVGGDSGQQTGTISLAITDAPVDYAESVNLLIEAVELKPASGPSVSHEIQDPEPINLLNLQGADARSLVDDFEVPAGQYDWIRLHVNADGETTDNAWIVINEDPGPYMPGEYPLFIPSAAQTGLKLVRGFTVPVDGEASFTIDLDLRKAIIRTGNGDFMMRPTFRLIDNLEVAHIQGDVARTLTEDAACFDELGQPWGSAVYLYQGSDVEPQPLSSGLDPEEGGPVTTAIVDVQGDADPIPFTIGFVEPGDYTVAFTCQSGRDSALDEDGNLVDDDADGNPEFYGQRRNVTVDASGETTPETVSFTVAE